MSKDVLNNAYCLQSSYPLPVPSVRCGYECGLPLWIIVSFSSSLFGMKINKPKDNFHSHDPTVPSACIMVIGRLNVKLECQCQLSDRDIMIFNSSEGVLLP